MSEQQRPATDLLLAQLAEAVQNVREHDHPRTEDFYCLNLVAWMGERMGPVLLRLADEQAEAHMIKDRLSALADEATETLTNLSKTRVDVSWSAEEWDVNCVSCGWSAEVEITRPTLAQLAEQAQAHACAAPR